MGIGIIGCGNMGGSMAAHMLENGQNIVCFDPDSGKVQEIGALGARVASSAQELANTCDRIILSLPRAEVVEAVINDIASDVQMGTIILDTSTSMPQTSKDMAALGVQHGFVFVDGPVSGGPIAARSGNMTMLLGGNQQAIDSLKSITDILTAKTVIVGGSGSGHAAKIANNMLCAANLVLVAEAVRLGEACGAGASDLLEGINAGSGRSGVSEVNFPKWILNDTFNSGFTMGLMRKDVGLALQLAKEHGVALEGFQEIANVWLNRSASITDNADFNAITKTIAKASMP